MKRAIAAVCVAVTLGVTACKDKPKEPSRAAVAEAGQHISEAEFALQIRDYKRAEELLTKAVELVPESSPTWIQLGAARKMLNDKSGAKKAYERARELVQNFYKKDKSSPGPIFAEMEVCVLLNKPEEAKKLYERLQRDHAADPLVKDFVNAKAFDNLLIDPRLQQMKL